jgi:hypothetical protein
MKLHIATIGIVAALYVAKGAVGQTWDLITYQLSDPESGLCPDNEKIDHDDDTGASECRTEQTGFNGVQFDGALTFQLQLYSNEDCPGSGTVIPLGPGSTGCRTFISEWKSWKVVRA